MHDLIVVGAGPVGSFLASLCCRGSNTLVLEEHARAGEKACSGLVSGRLKGLLPKKVFNSPGVVQHRVRAARIHVGNEVTELKNDEDVYVIDRGVLDRRLAEHAVSSGCGIEYGSRVSGVSVKDDRVVILAGKERYDAGMVAGCDGARSAVAGVIGSAPPVLLNGIIARVDAKDGSDCVEMWFDKGIVSDGFLWKIPRGSQTEYGAMGTGVKFPLIVSFFGLEKRGFTKEAAPIPMGLTKTFSDRLLLVGDAACQTKPWSGGGVTYGLLSAKVASNVIKKALDDDDFSEGALSKYEILWKKILGKDIRGGLAIRDLYQDLDMPEITRLLKALGPFGDGADAKGIDFDFPVSRFRGGLLSEML
jgi:geranylgeranyl reductase family protein